MPSLSQIHQGVCVCFMCSISNAMNLYVTGLHAYMYMFNHFVTPNLLGMTMYYIHVGILSLEHDLMTSK